MQESIISALAALLGTVIGVCTTLVIHRIDRKINERKIINESIHYLLEVYLQINRVDAKKMNDEFWNYYWQSIRKYIHGDDKSFESAKEQLSPIINKNLVTNTQQAYKELESLGKQYEDMVAKLAIIFPINAYYLRGKNNLAKFIQTISEYFDSIKELDIENETAVNEFIDQIKISVTTILLDDYKNDLKSELSELLKKTTCFNRRKGKRVIKKIESSVLTEDDKRKLDALVDKAISKMISMINQIEVQ